MNWDEFTSLPNGKEVYNHFANECVALANLYHEDVIGGTFVWVPSAYMWWDRFSEWKTLRDNYVQVGSPVAGAIFVSQGGIYNQFHGHIGVVTRVHPDGTFDTMEQNAGTWRFVGRYRRDLTDVLGFLVPHKNPAENLETTTEEVVEDVPTREDSDGMYIYLDRGAPNGADHLFAYFTPGVKGSWIEFYGQKSANQLADQKGNAMKVSRSFWDSVKKRHR